MADPYPAIVQEQAYDLMRVAAACNLPYGLVLRYADYVEAWALGLQFPQKKERALLREMQRHHLNYRHAGLIRDSVRRSPHYAHRHALRRAQAPGAVRDDVAPTPPRPPVER